MLSDILTCNECIETLYYGFEILFDFNTACCACYMEYKREQLEADYLRAAARRVTNRICLFFLLDLHWNLRLA